MICEYCGAELSAGDISVISISKDHVTWGVVCHSCDKTQSSEVEEKNGKFYVTMEKGVKK